MDIVVKRPTKGAKKTKKHRKHGRNKAFCERYLAEGRREKNKARRQARHQLRIAAKAAKLEGRQKP